MILKSSPNLLLVLASHLTHHRKPLEFHAVSFESDSFSLSLQRAANIAREVYDNAPRDPLAPAGNPCSYHVASDTVRVE